MPKSSTNRAPTLDIMRALAILLITLFHAWRKCGRPESTVLAGTLNWLEPISHGPIGVAMFVFLSGYVLTSYHKEQRFDQFLFRRWQRMAGPYYVAILFWWAASAWLNRLQPMPDTWSIVSHFLFLHTFDADTFVSINSVLWYVGLQFQLYLLFPILHRIMRVRFGPLLIAASSIALSVLSDIALTNTWVQSHNRVHLDAGVATYLAPFVIGMLFAMPSIRERCAVRNSYKSIGLTTVFACITFITFFWQTRLFPLSETELHMRGVIMCVFILMLQPVWQYFSKLLHPITMLGRISFSVYLYNYIMYIIPAHTQNPLAYMLTKTLITIVFGAGAYMIIEGPYNRWMAKGFFHVAKTPGPSGQDAKQVES
jgi:peptidoglycan/LPS O-acetylase OafA/YrhL